MQVQVQVQVLVRVRVRVRVQVQVRVRVQVLVLVLVLVLVRVRVRVLVLVRVQVLVLVLVLVQDWHSWTPSARRPQTHPRYRIRPHIQRRQSRQTAGRGSRSGNSFFSWFVRRGAMVLS